MQSRVGGLVRASPTPAGRRPARRSCRRRAAAPGASPRRNSERGPRGDLRARRRPARAGGSRRPPPPRGAGGSTSARRGCGPCPVSPCSARRSIDGDLAAVRARGPAPRRIAVGRARQRGGGGDRQPGRARPLREAVRPAHARRGPSAAASSPPRAHARRRCRTAPAARRARRRIDRWPASAARPACVARPAGCRARIPPACARRRGTAYAVASSAQPATVAASTVGTPQRSASAPPPRVVQSVLSPELVGIVSRRRRARAA